MHHSTSDICSLGLQNSIDSFMRIAPPQDESDESQSSNL